MNIQSRQERYENRQLIKSASHKRLRTNLSILAVVYVILFFVTLYHLFTTHLIWWQVLACLILGLIVGIVSSRMMKIDWNHDEEKVVGRMDIYGVVILVLFILFEVFRGKIIGLFVSSESIGTLSLLVLTAVMYGRIAATAKKIIIVARKELRS